MVKNTILTILFQDFKAMNIKRAGIEKYFLLWAVIKSIEDPISILSLPYASKIAWDWFYRIKKINTDYIEKSIRDEFEKS